MQPPDLPGGIDLLDQPADVVGLEQPAGRYVADGAAFPRRAAELGRDDVPRDPVQPCPRPAGRPAVSGRRVDRRQEDLGCQVGGAVVRGKER